jgi:hypothetical protein
VVTIGFLALGAAGLLILAVSLIFGELLHLGHIDADGPFSVPAVAGFVGALGFAGSLGSLLFSGVSLSLVSGAVAGLAGAFPVGWLATRITRMLAGLNTDGTPNATSLVGLQGVVVTPVPAGGYGEVRVLLGGQPVKLNAKADAPLATGAAVFVVAAPTETSVVVVETTPIS